MTPPTPRTPGDLLDSNRTFSPRQRDVLFRRAKGACQRCHALLQRSWSADHVIPWSLGGPTHVDNGQALCVACNLTKGKRTTDLPWNLTLGHATIDAWPTELPMRRWAGEFLSDYLTTERQDYLLVAVPGAGKTLAALRAVGLMWGQVERLVVVVPTERVRQQWIEAGTAVGIHLAPDLAVLPLPPYYHGAVITYQALTRAAPRLASLCSTERVMVILDEVHHAAEHLSWGQALADGTALARRRLSLSGTPFRTDRRPIAVISSNMVQINDRTWQTVANYTYGYQQALSDRTVVREVFFQTFDGTMTWVSPYAPDEQQSFAFSDAVVVGEASYRLRTFLFHEANALRSMLTSANERLADIRRVHPRAAGLVLATDQIHARHICAILRDLTGVEPALAISDLPNAADTISDFTRSDDPWLVTVRMVSEGVDVQRLRVGVMASSWTTELYFRQAVGRFVRYQAELGPMEGQAAHVYLPADERLVALARRVATEVEAAARIRTAEMAAPWNGDDRVGAVALRRPAVRNIDAAYQPLSAEVEVIEGFGPDGPITPAELADISALLQRRQARQPLYMLARAERRRLEDEFRELTGPNLFLSRDKTPDLYTDLYPHIWACEYLGLEIGPVNRRLRDERRILEARRKLAFEAFCGATHEQLQALVTALLTHHAARHARIHARFGRDKCARCAALNSPEKRPPWDRPVRIAALDDQF